jgi:uncharacterized membrane protein
MGSNYAFSGEAIALARQMIAEFLMVLSILLLLEKRIPEGRRRILLIVLGAGLIVSHYALAYIYISLVILAYVVLKKWRFKDVLSASLVLLLFSMTFGWYIYVSNAPLLAVSDDIRRIVNNFMNDISSPAARSPQVATLASAPTTVVSVMNRIVFLASNSLIAIGVAALSLMGRKSNLDSKYRLMSVVALFIMIMCVALPNVASTFNFSRFYGIMMIFLAPFFVLGGQTILHWTNKAISPLSAKMSRLQRLRNSRMLGLQLISILLVASFLFNTGFIEHVTGVYPGSMALDKDLKRVSEDSGIRLSYFTSVILEQDVVSIMWLSTYMDDYGVVYNGALSLVWWSYGPIDRSIDLQSSIYAFNGTQNARTRYAYLSYANTVGGFLNNTEISPALTSGNEIYTNGASEIFSNSG